MFLGLLGQQGLKVLDLDLGKDVVGTHTPGLEIAVQGLLVTTGAEQFLRRPHDRLEGLVTGRLGGLPFSDPAPFLGGKLRELLCEAFLVLGLERPGHPKEKHDQYGPHHQTKVPGHMTGPEWGPIPGCTILC